MPSKEWKYRERTPETIKRRSEQKGSSYDSIIKGGIDIFTPTPGTNIIRFLPVPMSWESDHYALDVYVHRYIGVGKGSYICPVKTKATPPKFRTMNCPICAVSERAYKQGDKEDGYRFAAIKRCIAWVINRNDKDLLPRVFNMPWKLDKNIQEISQSKKTGKTYFIDNPFDGFDVEFTRTGTDQMTTYDGAQIERDPSPVSESQKERDRIRDFIEENPIPSILQFVSVDKLKEAISGNVEEPDEELDAPVKADEEEEQTEKPDDTEEEADQETQQDNPDEASAEEEDDLPFDPDDEEEEVEPEPVKVKVKSRRK